MVARRFFLAVLTLLATACGKDSPPPAADKPADKSAKPADKPIDKPVDKTADKPVDKAADKPALDKPVDKPSGPTWETYTSKEGGFTMELPGKANMQEKAGMKIVSAQFGATGADSRDASCGAAYVKLEGKPDAKKALDGATKRHKENAKVIEDKDIKLGKHPGRSLIVENTSHRKWMRVYLVDQTIYIANCGGPFDRAAADEPIALKSLASFALAK